MSMKPDRSALALSMVSPAGLLLYITIIPGSLFLLIVAQLGQAIPSLGGSGGRRNQVVLCLFRKDFLMLAEGNPSREGLVTSQPSSETEKDRGSIASFWVESLASADRRGF